MDGRLLGKYLDATKAQDWDTVEEIFHKTIEEANLGIEDFQKAGIIDPNLEIPEGWRLKKSAPEHIQKESEPKDFNDPLEIERWIKDNESPPKRGRIYLQDQYETLRSINLKGIDLTYAETERETVKKFVDLIGNSGIHPKLFSYTKNISFSGEAVTNVQYEDFLDEKLSKRVEGFASKDRIVISKSSSFSPTIATVIHELGHTVAWGLWGSPSPPKDSAYGVAQSKERPVSSYGSTNPAEDFAEACRMYFSKNNDRRERLRREFPLKAKALDDIFN